LTKQPLIPQNLALIRQVPPLALVTALGVAAAMLIVPRFTRHYLVTPSIIAGGVALFYVTAFASGSSVAAARAQGLIFESVASATVLPYAGLLGSVNWLALLSQWANLLAVSVVVVLGVTLNAAGLELATQHDADFDRELRINGLANIVAGLTGGATGGLSASRTILMVKAGASSRIAGIWAALVCLAATFFLKPVLFLFPEPVLAGLLLGIGLGLMRDWLWDTFFKLPLAEYLLIVFIVLAIVIYGLMPGISFGFVVAGLLFVYRYGHTDHVRHNFPVSLHGSNRERTLPEREALAKLGERARALCLHGYLFFGTAQGIVETCRSAITNQGVRCIVLDFRLVEGIDASAVTSFAKLGQLCARTGVRLAFAGLGATSKQSLEKMQILGPNGIQEFSDLDHALEWVEDGLLSAAKSQTEPLEIDAPPGGPQPVCKPILESTLAFRPEPQPIEVLTRSWTLLDLAEGSMLFRKGEVGDALYLIEHGEVSVSLDLGQGRRKRLRTFGPGTIVGEMAMYTGAPRSADVIADTDCQLRRLDAQELRQMQAEDPQAAIEFHNFIVRLLAKRLTAANDEISILL
jgi:sulfate permease, SulP family